MLVQDEENVSTLRFCRSEVDGSIAPAWDDSREAQLQGEFEVGLTIDNRYLLQKKLGNGSMGRVFLARDLRLDRCVALKVVLYQGRKTISHESALEREAKLGANLNHKAIAAVYDFGFHGDKSYTVFEYVEGETLRSLIRRRGRLPLEEVLQIVSDLAAALDFAHIKGVIHRDLKPENICYTKSGEFKILDFGLAYNLKRTCETRAYSGTPAYSSPEQAECRPTDGKSDKYALGLIVFELLTGGKAFIDSNPHSLLEKQIKEPPPQPSRLVSELPDYAERAILRALSKCPDERFSSCQEFARKLGGGNLVTTQRRVVAIPEEVRIGFYIAHAAEESLLARQIGDELEHRRYRCWFYGRNAIPGVPFVNQANSAIERCQALVLLISRSAMRSADFEREITHSYSVDCPLMPLLVDMSREEFEKLAPSWRRMLGSSPIIEYRRSEPLLEIINRIAAAANTLEIDIDESTGVTSFASTERCTGQSWVTDANQIDYADLVLGRVQSAALTRFVRTMIEMYRQDRCQRLSKCDVSTTKFFLNEINIVANSRRR